MSTLKEPNSKLQRWKIKLEEFDFQIEYIQGKENKVADALSRVKINENKKDAIHLLEADSLTQHSGESDSTDLIPISEKSINTYNRQIILEFSENDSQEIVYPHTGKRRVIIKRKEFNKEDFEDISKEVDIKMLNGIYTQSEQIFKDFQEYWREHNNHRRLHRCIKLLKDLKETEIDEINLRNIVNLIT